MNSVEFEGDSVPVNVRSESLEKGLTYICLMTVESNY